MTPAKASKPLMKLTGPEAMPPPESVSMEPRRLEKFVPVPEPHLKSIPSVLVRFMMESIESWTELMKQAEHWGFCCTPRLNQTGELKATIWLRRRWVSSWRKVSRSSGEAK